SQPLALCNEPLSRETRPFLRKVSSNGKQPVRGDMRSIWNGSISFGLVSIPVKLYAAVSPTGISFRLLCRKCMTPVRYERRCEGCKGEVKWEDTLKALDLGDGQFLPFEQDEIDA